MPLELKHSSLKAFLVPNHTQVSVKLRAEESPMENWEYRGFDDERLFILVTKGKLFRWLPVSAISYIEQTQSESH